MQYVRILLSSIQNTCLNNLKSVIINILTSLTNLLIRISPPTVSNRVKYNLFQKLDVYGNAFTTYHLRPKNSKDYLYDKNLNDSNALIAIVIQGPLLIEEDFTIETIRFYKKTFQNHLIIISTWEDTDTRILKLLELEKVTIVLSSKPNNNGPLNINLQIASSKAGVIKAKELGAEFVYKTRADQRMYKNLTNSLITLQHTFPVLNDTEQAARIIACSFTTLKYRPYGVGDMLMFGHISDMIEYWDSKYDIRFIQKDEYENLSVLNYAKVRLAETYLCTNYLNKKGYDLKWTLEDSWRVYSDRFCIVDAEMFDLFWFKYEWRIEKRFNFYKSNTMQCLKFTDWLEIKSNWNRLLIDESVLNNREGDYL